MYVLSSYYLVTHGWRSDVYRYYMHTHMHAYEQIKSGQMLNTGWSLAAHTHIHTHTHTHYKQIRVPANAEYMVGV